MMWPLLMRQRFVRAAIAARQKARPSDPSYWIARAAWSGTIVFLTLTGLALIVGLPSGRQIGSEMPFDIRFQLLFPGAFTVLYAILAMNLGQMEAGWRDPVTDRFTGQPHRPLAQQALAFGLTLPYWLIYQATNYLPWPDLLALILQQVAWGYLASLFGLTLGLGKHSEIAQFNLKYLVFIVFLAGSLHPAISLINPFVSASLVLSGGAGKLSAWGGFIVWSTLAAAISFWVYRRLQSQRKETRESPLPSA
jgi:hypothetical protein